MVIRIQGTTSCGNVHLFKGAHAWQDTVRRRAGLGTGPMVQSLESADHSLCKRLLERRRLRQAMLARHSEMAGLSFIEVDTELLTGNLDEDISILDIVT
jgi:hypothetical protein